MGGIAPLTLPAAGVKKPSSCELLGMGCEGVKKLSCCAPWPHPGWGVKGASG
jgi:hypothetical protein